MEIEVTSLSAQAAANLSLIQMAVGLAMSMKDQGSDPTAPQVRNTYWPEMGAGRPSKLFHANHIVGTTFSLCWMIADDVEARKTMQLLKISTKTITMRSKPHWPEAQWLDSDVYSCLVSGKDIRKLNEANLVAIRMMKD